MVFQGNPTKLQVKRITNACGTENEHKYAVFNMMRSLAAKLKSVF